MILVLCVCLFGTPFYEGHFTSTPMRSVSVFSNPAGLGFHPGSELYFEYLFDDDGPDMLMPAVAMRNFGFGWKKIDTLNYFEVGLGYRLPGALSLGYAYQFGDRKGHILAMRGHPIKQLSIGYKTTVGDTFHMFGGLSIYPVTNYVTISGDIEYEDSIWNYFYGIMLQPLAGLKLYFHADKEFRWTTGLGLSLGQVVIAGAYHSDPSRFAGGILLSARPYDTFLWEKEPPPE